MWLHFSVHALYVLAKLPGSLLFENLTSLDTPIVSVCANDYYLIIKKNKRLTLFESLYVINKPTFLFYMVIRGKIWELTRNNLSAIAVLKANQEHTAGIKLFNSKIF